MYGTLGEKTGDTPGDKKRAPEDKRIEQVHLSSNQARKRRGIYSHCHVQSAETGRRRSDRPEKAGELASTTPDHGADGSARKRLITASIICLLFMLGEIVGGIVSNSLAIATDAAHLLTDFASFMISLFALWLSARPASKRMSFGWHRAEVIGALLSVLMIWLVTGSLVFMAIERLRTKHFEIDSSAMVITAAAGLVVNIIMAIALNVDGHSHGLLGHSHHSHARHNHQVHVDDRAEGCASKQNRALISQQRHHQQATANGLAKSSSSENGSAGGPDDSDLHHSHGKRPSLSPSRTESLNVRAAFIHVLGDFLQSLGVLVAALVIHFEPSYSIVDPICTFLFSFIVLLTTVGIIRDAINILMEGIPDGINFLEIQSSLHSLPHVIRVHNLRIWSLSLDKIALSTHLVIDSRKTTSSETLKLAIKKLKMIHDFFELTIQIEELLEDMKDCEHCREEDDNNASADNHLLIRMGVISVQTQTIDAKHNPSSVSDSMA